jgi:protein SCO1
MNAIAFFLAAAAVVPQQYAPGRALPRIGLIDDSGGKRSTGDWKGLPAILVPMYTRCPVACPMITEGLERAVENSKMDPTKYRVILFSFDPRDTPADLRAFREQHRVPLAWTLATARPADARLLMESLDVRTSDVNGVIVHPNLAIAITPDLKTAKYLFGTDFNATELDEAISVARGGTDWIGRYGGYALAILLLVCILSAVYLASGLFGSAGLISPSRSA